MSAGSITGASRATEYGCTASTASCSATIIPEITPEPQADAGIQQRLRALTERWLSREGGIATLTRSPDVSLSPDIFSAGREADRTLGALETRVLRDLTPTSRSYASAFVELRDAIRAQYDLRTALKEYVRDARGEQAELCRIRIMDCDRRISEMLNIAAIAHTQEEAGTGVGQMMDAVTLLMHGNDHGMKKLSGAAGDMFAELDALRVASGRTEIDARLSELKKQVDALQLRLTELSGVSGNHRGPVARFFHGVMKIMLCLLCPEKTRASPHSIGEPILLYDDTLFRNFSQSLDRALKCSLELANTDISVTLTKALQEMSAPLLSELNKRIDNNPYSGGAGDRYRQYLEQQVSEINDSLAQPSEAGYQRIRRARQTVQANISAQWRMCRKGMMKPEDFSAARDLISSVLYAGGAGDMFIDELRAL